ncbi:gastrula zinc finger protein XlCGF57.1-like [Pimephales promelas]|nr:gastrula zinc finger protein XlCGF57.1-like [Pimephales promelas]
MSQLARHLILWSQKHLRSLRAIHIPGVRNCAADELSRLSPVSGEWRLHPQSVQLICDQFGDAQIYLFASHDSSHCTLYYSLTEGMLGTDALAHSWPRGPRKYAFPPVSHLERTLCKIMEDEGQRCSISVVLSFLQDGLERRLSPSTLKVYVAAISAYHKAVEGKSLGNHDLIIRYLRGARRLYPPHPPLVPSWDLSVVLSSLQRPTFEPLQSVEIKFLSFKTVLLVALASIKRVGDLHAFSVDEACLEFLLGYSHVILRPRPGYVPKVPTTPFRDQVENLQALPLEEADPALALLCPKGRALSKQRLSHWIVDTIALAYQQQGRPCLLGVTAHSTRSVASSWALAHGASLADICRAAGWATPNTFARFNNLQVEPVSSLVLAHPASTGPAQAGGGGVMVWGIFSWHSLGPLVPIEHRCNATAYLSIVADHVHPFMTTMYPTSDGYFQQDNAPCHKAGIISDWFLEHDNEFAVLKWPPQSPDLNPIEHLWDVVEREIRIMDVQPTNLQQLCDAIMSIWTKLPEECFQHLVESMPRRIEAVLKAKGGPTRY